jgi:hypothetical protein
MMQWTEFRMLNQLHKGGQALPGQAQEQAVRNLQLLVLDD